MRVIGFDPGLRRTGWGVVDVSGSRLSHVANGVCGSGSEPGLAERLVDVPAAGPFCAEQGFKLIDSADPDNSLLLLKLSVDAPCGSAMPLGSGPAGLTDNELACMQSYVHDLASR